MSTQTTILALITSLTTGHILFLALYLWFTSGRHLANRLLSLLLFCYALRIIKSVLLLAFPGVAFSEALIAIGVIGMSAIGPLLWMYIQAITKENFILTPKLYAHFIPAAILLPTAFFLDDDAMFQVYQFSVYQIIIYIFFSIVNFMKWKKNEVPGTDHVWMRELFIAAVVLSIIFLTQLYTDSRAVYIAVSILASIVFYIISLRATFGKNPSYPQLKKRTKKNGSNLLPVIEQKLAGEQLYLDPSITVSRLAEALKIPAYTLSSAVNEESGMGFNEYLNSFRIREAAARLVSTEYDHLSVEGIAYDCGFKSLSAFYNAFKKVYHVTPARFRQKSFPDSVNQEDLIGNTGTL